MNDVTPSEFWEVVETRITKKSVILKFADDGDWYSDSRRRIRRYEVIERLETSQSDVVAQTYQICADDMDIPPLEKVTVDVSSMPVRFVLDREDGCSWFVEECSEGEAVAHYWLINFEWSV